MCLSQTTISHLPGVTGDVKNDPILCLSRPPLLIHIHPHALILSKLTICPPLMTFLLLRIKEFSVKQAKVEPTCKKNA